MARLLVGNSGADIPGVQNDIVGTWMARNSWENLRDTNWLVNNPDYMSYLTAHQDRAADIGVPLIPHDMQWDLNPLLDEAISGTRDSIYSTMGNNLALNGPQTVYARVYWEMNMSPDPAGRLDRAKFIAAWQRVIPLMRSGFAAKARAGQTLKIVWCPLSDGAPKMEFWPGGTYVDVVAVDAYASKWSATTPTAAELTSWVAAQLQEIADIGRAQSKPVAMGEWSNWSSKPTEQGTAGSKGRDDFPAYIDQMFDWALTPANNVVYLCYYNISALGTDQVITDTPLSLARYQARTTAVQGGTATPPPTGGGSSDGVGSTLFSETFTGSNGAAWDSSRWALGKDTNVGGGATIQNNEGRLATGTTGGYNSSADRISRRLNITDVADTDTTFDVRLSGEVNSSGFWFRSSNQNEPYTGSGYQLTLSDAQVTLFWMNNYSNTSLGMASGGLTQNTTYSFRVRAFGSSLKVKFWPQGQAEPSTWAIDVTHTGKTTAGMTGFGTNGGGAAASQFVYLDNVTVRQATAATSAPALSGSLTTTGTSVLTLSGIRSTATARTGPLALGATSALALAGVARVGGSLSLSRTSTLTLGTPTRAAGALLLSRPAPTLVLGGQVFRTYRAQVAIFIGSGAGFVRAFNASDVVPESVAQVLGLTDAEVRSQTITAAGATPPLATT